MLASFKVRLGTSKAWGMQIVSTDFDGEPVSLAGTVAILEFASPASATARLTIRSDEVATDPAVFDWDPGATSGQLNVKLSPAQIAALGIGTWTGVVKLEDAAQTDWQHDPDTMEIGVTVERWPAQPTP